MKNDEYKRVRKLIVFSLLFGILMFFAAVGYFSFQYGKTHKEIQLIADKQPTIIHGLDGQNGLSGRNGLGYIGPQGVPGKNGADGKSVTPTQIASAVVAYLQAHPVKTVKGDQGDKGKDAPSITFAVDHLTCQLREQIQGDDGWTVLAQLPNPCEVKS